MEKYEQEHLDQVLKTAAECTLFLKKDDAFPLDGPCKIAAYGNGVKGGTGSGDVYSRFSVNVEKGLTDAGFELTTGKWLEEYDKLLDEGHKRFVDGIKKQAKELGVNAFFLSFEFIDGLFQPVLFFHAQHAGAGSDL